MKKWYVLIALVLVLGLALSACGQPEPATPATPTTPAEPAKPATPAAPSGPQYGGVLKVILTGPISAIGGLGAPHEAKGGMYPRIGRPAMECLWYYNGQERFVPKLAESWDTTPDGKALDIHLRKGVKFHDGTPLNAQALADNFTMIKESKDNPAYAASLYKNVTSWAVIDEYTVRVNFSAYDVKFMYSLAERGLVSPTAANKPTTPENLAKDHMVGTGPFKFVNYEQGQFVEYTKNDNYWEQGKPYLDGFTFNEVADGVTAVLSFKKGDAPLIFGITSKNTADLKASGFDILSTAAMVNYIMPAGANPNSPWSKLKVRQAAEYAIDKKEIAKLGQGYYEPVTQFATPKDARYVQGLAPREYDPEKAKQLLTEAGYPSGFKSSLIASTSYNREILVALQTYLKEAGIDCTLDIVDRAKSAELRTKGWDDGVVCPGVPFVGTIQSCYSSFGPGYYPGMYKDTFDQVLEEANKEPDYDKRMVLMQKLIKVMYDDAMAIPIWAAPDLSAINSKLLKGDIQWTIGHPNFFEPQNAWLTK
jgi:peptide/nickel transport system substrate-binding protein